MSTGITVEEAMRLPALAGARVIGGASGTQRVIRSVNVMEVPDIARWVREDELLVTTAYPLREDRRALDALVPLLADRHLAALAVKPGRYLFDVPAAMLEAAERRGFPLIELPPDVSFNDILADVLGSILNQQAIELVRSRAIHERLTSVVLAGNSLTDLVSTLADLVGGPAMIVDGHGQALATAGLPGPAESRLTRPIAVGSVHHGEVVAWPAAASEEPDAVLAMEHAATIAALLISQSRAIASREQRYRLVMLHELVSGRPVNREEVLERASALGWDLTVPRAAVVVQLQRAGEPEEVPVAGQPLEEQLGDLVRATLGGQAISWGIRLGLAVLVPAAGSEAAKQAGEKLRASIQRTQRRLVASVGVGRVSPDPADFAASYNEALQALALGRKLQAGGFVLRHDELGLYSLLDRLGAEPVLDRYRLEMLAPLLDYDRRHRGALVKTLECYLRHDRNMAAAARELFVAYNTLRYRLQLIDRLTGGLDRSPTSRVSTEVALHIHRMLGGDATVVSGGG